MTIIYTVDHFGDQLFHYSFFFCPTYSTNLYIIKNKSKWLKANKQII